MPLDELLRATEKTLIETRADQKGLTQFLVAVALIFKNVLSPQQTLINLLESFVQDMATNVAANYFTELIGRFSDEKFSPTQLRQIGQVLDYYWQTQGIRQSIGLEHTIGNLSQAIDTLDQDQNEILTNVLQLVVDLHQVLTEIQADQKKSLQMTTLLAQPRERRMAKSEVGMFQVPSLPNHLVNRHSEVLPVFERIIADNDSRILSIVGQSGSGKSTFAVMLAELCYKTGNFPGGIFWLDAGESEKIITQMQLMYSALTGNVAVNIHTEESAAIKYFTHELQKALDGRTILIILDDVTNKKTVQAWQKLIARTQSKILITSTNKFVSREFGETIELAFLNNDDSLKLLNAWAGHDFQSCSKKTKEYIYRVWLQCGNSPFLLRMAGSYISGDPKKWGALVQSLDASRIPKILERFTDKEGLDPVKLIDAKLTKLPPDTQSAYLDLIILDGKVISTDDLVKFWQHSGYTKQQSTLFLTQLLEHSLLERSPDGKKVRLHSLHWHYIVQKGRNPQAIHARVVDNYRAKCGGDWGKIVHDDYYYKHIGFHMWGAKKFDDLHSLYLNLDWLERKYLLSNDVLTLLEEMLPVGKKEKDVMEIMSAIFDAVDLLEDSRSEGARKDFKTLVLANLRTNSENEAIRTIMRNSQLNSLGEVRHRGRPVKSMATVGTRLVETTGSVLFVSLPLLPEHDQRHHLPTGLEIKRVFSSDQKGYFYALDNQNRLLCFNLDEFLKLHSHEERHSPRVVVENVKDVAFSNNHHFFVVYSFDEKLALYKSATNNRYKKEMITRTLLEGIRPDHLTISDDGKMVYMIGDGGRGQEIITWNPQNNKVFRTGTLLKAKVTAVDFFEAEKLLCAGLEDGCIYTWFSPENNNFLYQHMSPVTKVLAITARDGSGCVVSGHKDGSIFIKTNLDTDVKKLEKCHMGAITDLAFGEPDVLISTSADGKTKDWSLYQVGAL